MNFLTQCSNYGVEYSTLDFELTGEIYDSGRHFNGIGLDFIQYPSTIQLFAYTNESFTDMDELSCWTSGGQTIYLEISFFAKFIDKQKLKDFYLMWGVDWRGFFIRASIRNIKEASTQFSELDFYQKRGVINDYIQASLSELFMRLSEGALNVTEVQMRKIELDSDLERAVESKLIELQS